jgi:hypothetical protein
MDDKKGESFENRKTHAAIPAKNISTFAINFRLFKALFQISQQGTLETLVNTPFNFNLHSLIPKTDQYLPPEILKLFPPHQPFSRKIPTPKVSYSLNFLKNKFPPTITQLCTLRKIDHTRARPL